MRTRVPIDPGLVAVALVVTVVGIFLGLGWWAPAAGAAALLAGGGWRPVVEALEGRRLPPAGSPERELVLRARRARRMVRRLARVAAGSPFGDRCAAVARDLALSERQIALLARQAESTRQLAAGFDGGALAMEARRIASAVEGADERSRRELASSLRSTQARLATAGRVGVLADELEARTAALVASSEAIAAELTEVLALSQVDPGGGPLGRMEEIADEVEALRAGLEEAQGFGRQAAALHHMEES